MTQSTTVHHQRADRMRLAILRCAAAQAPKEVA